MYINLHYGNTSHIGVWLSIIYDVGFEFWVVVNAIDLNLHCTLAFGHFSTFNQFDSRGK